ncbi:MAG: HDIG domain-containing protein [Verrucomicrobia bacterium]|nr:HDIG domain-containing protein [Verrucomicrobiota bacterium]
MGYLLLALPVAAVILFFFEPLGKGSAGATQWRVLPGVEQVEGIFGLVTGFVLFYAFQRRFWPRSEGETRALRSAVYLVLLEALILRLTHDVGVYFQGEWGFPREEGWLRSPWFFAPALAVVLLGWRYGVLLSLSGVWMFVLLARPGLLSLVAAVLGSMAAVLWLRRSTTRSRVLRAGLWSGALVSSCILLGELLSGSGDPTRCVRLVGIALGVGFGSGILLLAFLPFVEWALGELSDVSLTEYGTDHRLLDELRERAPGTWNHTLNVADLARQAAGAIGARALLCHTAALFHDIGKLHRPEVFAENIDGASPHDEMEPGESARLIIEHVTQGLELARKHRLPRPFRSIIVEHHGCSLVRFFYAKAVKLAAEGEHTTIAEEDFRYPGPPPSSKESGIISLADAVEAATRSMGDSSPGEIREVVRHLIAERVAEGEYASCPLTLAELGQIEASFQAWLAARCHKRPAYPQAEPVSSAQGAGVG